MTTITSCPICESKKLEPFLNCTDYTVSRETFSLQRCGDCAMVITSPRPDEDQIGMYYQSEDYISHTNKAASLIDKIYLQARRYTLRWKLALINSAKPTRKTLLDYGCGTGAFLQFAQQNHWTVDGIEPSIEARQIASQHIQREVATSINEVQGNKFAVITLWHVLEHVPNLDDTIMQLRNCLEEDGTIFIAVPNHKSWDAKRYREYWAGFDVPRHLWHFSQTTMKLLMTKNKLRITQILPMKLDAFYISLLSEKYKSSTSSITGMIKAFFNGMRSNQNAKGNNEYSSLIYVIKK